MARATCDTQSADLTALANRFTSTEAALARDVERARTATDEFAEWLEKEAATKTAPSGVGIENYNWYLPHVMLLPYSWRDLVTLMERELARAYTSLALEARLRSKSSSPIASATGRSLQHDAVRRRARRRG